MITLSCQISLSGVPKSLLLSNLDSYGDPSKSTTVMGSDSTTSSVQTIKSVDQPDSLKALLAEDRGDNCLPCRVLGKHCNGQTHLLPLFFRQSLIIFTITGASAFIGLGVYSYFSGRYQLRQQQAAIVKSKSLFGMRSRQWGISGIATMLVGAGVWRLIY